MFGVHSAARRAVAEDISFVNSQPSDVQGRLLVDEASSRLNRRSVIGQRRQPARNAGLQAIIEQFHEDIGTRVARAGEVKRDPHRSSASPLPWHS